MWIVLAVAAVSSGVSGTKWSRLIIHVICLIPIIVGTVSSSLMPISPKLNNFMNQMTAVSGGQHTLPSPLTSLIHSPL